MLLVQLCCLLFLLRIGCYPIENKDLTERNDSDQDQIDEILNTYEHDSDDEKEEWETDDETDHQMNLDEQVVEGEEEEEMEEDVDQDFVDNNVDQVAVDEYADQIVAEDEEIQSLLQSILEAMHVLRETRRSMYGSTIQEVTENQADDANPDLESITEQVESTNVEASESLEPIEEESENEGQMQLDVQDNEWEDEDIRPMENMSADLFLRLARFGLRLVLVIKSEYKFHVSRQDQLDKFIQIFLSIKENHLPSLSMIFNFEDENGNDAQGLTREFFNIMTVKLYDPASGFIKYDDQGYMVFNEMMNYNLSVAFGRFLGYCFRNEISIGTSFRPSFYKQLIGRSVGLSDLEEENSILYNSLNSLRDADSFVLEDLSFDVMIHGEAVNLKNEIFEPEMIEEYIDLYAQADMMAHGPKNEIVKVIQAEFSKVISGTMPSRNSLKNTLEGTKSIDLEHLKLKSELESVSSELVLRYLEENPQNHQKFWRFLTGSEFIPHLLSNNYYVKITDMNYNGLPVAHTCMNHLELGSTRYSDNGYDLFVSDINRALEETYFGLE